MMFWTAVIWGLGVAIGASIGVMPLVLLFAALTVIGETEAAKSTSGHSESVLAALDRKNELSKRQVEHICEIVKALDKLTLANQRGGNGD